MLLVFPSSEAVPERGSSSRLSSPFQSEYINPYRCWASLCRRQETVKRLHVPENPVRASYFLPGSQRGARLAIMADVDPDTLLEWLQMGQGDERDMQLIALEQLCMLLLMSDNVDRCFETISPVLVCALCSGEQSFDGNIYNLRLWDYAMSMQELSALSCNVVGNIIDWDNSHWTIPSTLAQTDTTLSCSEYSPTTVPARKHSLNL
ncbi:hypothetical protein PFLUV_G00237710 [Perca fluviatilis]|uniref:E3 ubiquitin-protein ligase n=1 Tax=Perca fluviatilis TaxID=8168 RepID=A0A6A5E905_PERFL|nr:hypothetical protein PFLUV_G00237710 [Perca fluviatilis]